MSPFSLSQFELIVAAMTLSFANVDEATWWGSKDPDKRTSELG